MENRKELSKKVRGLIEENKRKEALDLLAQAQLPHLEDDISALKSQYNKLLDDQTLGVVDNETINLETNKINKKFFNILDKLERDEPELITRGGIAYRVIVLAGGVAGLLLLAFFGLKSLNNNVVANETNSEIRPDPAGKRMGADTVSRGGAKPDSINILELESLVAYYPFDDNAKDLMGMYNSNNSKNIKYIKDRAGTGSAAVYLKGDAYIEFPKILKPENNKLSIALWVKADKLKSTANVDVIETIWQQSTNSAGKWIGQNHSLSLIDGAVDYDNYPPGNDERTRLVHGFEDENVIIASEWTHIVLTRNDSKILLYLNGVEVASNDNSESFNNEERGPVALSILGARKNAIRNKETGVIGDYYYRDFFKGSVDDLCIFNAAIDEKVVLDLYHKIYK